MVMCPSDFPCHVTGGPAMGVKSPSEDALLTPEGNEEEERKPRSVKSVKSKGASFALWLGPFFFRNPKRFTWPEWVFLAVSAAGIIAAIVFNIRNVVVFSDKATAENSSVNGSFCNSTSPTGFVFSCQSDLVLAMVVLTNILFVAYYVIDGLLREHQFELFAYILAILSITLYIVINYGFQATKPHPTVELTKPWRLARLVVTLVLSPISIAFALVVFCKMGALQFDALGANPTILRAYKWTRALSALMKIHFELLLSLFLMVVTRVPLETAPLAPHPAELAFLCALLLANLVAWATSSIGTYLEWKSLSITSLVLMAVAVPYYVFRMVWTSVAWAQSTRALKTKMDFVPTDAIAIVMLVLCVSGVVLVVLSFPLSIKVMFNFGKGLKAKLLSS